MAPSLSVGQEAVSHLETKSCVELCVPVCGMCTCTCSDLVYLSPRPYAPNARKHEHTYLLAG